MLAIQKSPKYFSRMMTMPNGVPALVVFELIERNGHLVAKAVYAEAVDTSTIPEEKVFALPGVKSPVEFIPIKSVFYHQVSDFLKDFSFVKSQRTRAPSFC
jgi:hypothetical protein